jgi:hypothetical protein
MDPYPWQQVTGNDRTDDPDHDVSDKSKATAADELASQPTGNSADHKPNKDV